MRQVVGLTLVILILGLAYLSYQNQGFPFNSTKQNFQSVVPQSKKYEGNSIVFNYPASWNPNPKDLESKLEDINLGVPNVVDDQKLEFLSTPLNELDFSDLDTQSYLTFNKREWMVGTRKNSERVTYLYYTNFPVEDPEDPRQSFGLHVTVPKEDVFLEKQLQDIIASIRFK